MKIIISLVMLFVYQITLANTEGVVSYGSGKTEQEAINSALSKVVDQYSNIYIQSKQKLENKNFSESIQKSSNGLISKYKVLESKRFDNSFLVKLKVFLGEIKLRNHQVVNNEFTIDKSIEETINFNQNQIINNTKSLEMLLGTPQQTLDRLYRFTYSNAEVLEVSGDLIRAKLTVKVDVNNDFLDNYYSVLKSIKTEDRKIESRLESKYFLLDNFKKPYEFKQLVKVQNKIVEVPIKQLSMAASPMYKSAKKALQKENLRIISKIRKAEKNRDQMSEDWYQKEIKEVKQALMALKILSNQKKQKIDYIYEFLNKLTDWKLPRDSVLYKYDYGSDKTSIVDAMYSKYILSAFHIDLFKTSNKVETLLGSASYYKNIKVNHSSSDQPDILELNNRQIKLSTSADRASLAKNNELFFETTFRNMDEMKTTIKNGITAKVRSNSN